MVHNPFNINRYGNVADIYLKLNKVHSSNGNVCYGVIINSFIDIAKLAAREMHLGKQIVRGNLGANTSERVQMYADRA